MVTSYFLVGYVLFQFTLQVAVHHRVLQTGLCWKDQFVSVPLTSLQQSSSFLRLVHILTSWQEPVLRLDFR